MRCPGRYCGIYEDVCSACPRGLRVNLTSELCEPCVNKPLFYDWLYMGFMFLTVLYFHMETLTRHVGRDVKGAGRWLIVTVVETILSAILTLLLSDPYGSFSLNSCGVDSFLDWYSVFQNPAVRFTQTIYCESEVIYPLYSISFKFLGFCLILMLVCRTWYHPVAFTTRSVYNALYFIPLIALLHSMLCGLIYYSFPYLCVAGSLILTAVIMAENLQNFDDVKEHMGKPVFMIQIVMYWVLHGYGILSIVAYNSLSYWYLFLTPIPTVFYLVTLPFSLPVVLSISNELPDGNV